MRKQFYVVICFALATAVLLIGSSVQAGIISDPSFEDQTLSNGGVATFINGWSIWTSLGGGGVVANVTGYDGADNDTAYGFIGASGDGTPQGADGPNCAWMAVDAGQYDLLQQTLPVTLEAGNTYTLTVAVGKVPSGNNPNSQLLFSTADAPQTFLAYCPGMAPESMTTAAFVDQSLSYTCAPGDPNIGKQLVINLCGYQVGGETGGWITFDNVRMDVVPEPGTIVLLSTGLVGLLVCAWRKRN